MYDLEDAITERRSTRMFLRDKPVPRDLVDEDGLGVGMFVQTLLLALTARGLGTCVLVSIAGYPGIVREQLGISEDMRILCGLAIGYPDPEFAANSLRVPRNPVESNVVFVDR